ncbi:MAG: hypothetical protein QOG77_2441 [Solirubrobacteraceae bacterium]|jgi:hypothetical protein|nr:hypothetical protein [Solirubrobacteraceae bacterium]
MALDRTVADARLKSLHSEVLRGLALAALRRAEEVHEEAVATRNEIRQRRLSESRDVPRLTWSPRSAAQR